MAFSTFNSGQPLYGQGSTTGYTAIGDRQFIKATAVTAGVRQIKTPVANVKQGDLAVQSTGAANGSVNILAGDCWVAGATGYGFYYAYNDATITQVITPTASIRTDVIYVAITDTGAANPTVTLGYGAGTAVPANTATACYLPLASIAVPAGFSASSTVADTTITDTRKKAQLMDFSVTNTSSVGAATAGNLIYDTSASAVKAYNGTAWDSLMQGTNTGVVDNATGNYRYTGTVISASTNTPAAPTTGLIWFQTDTSRYFSWTGSAWQQIMSQVSFPSATPTITQGVGMGSVGADTGFNRMGRLITGYSRITVNTGAGTANTAILVTFPMSATLPTPVGSLPTSASAATGPGEIVGTFIYNTGTNYFVGAATLIAGTPGTFTFYVNGATTALGQTGGSTPAVTIAAGHKLYFFFSYLASS